MGKYQIGIIQDGRRLWVDDWRLAWRIYRAAWQWPGEHTIPRLTIRRRP